MSSEFTRLTEGSSRDGRLPYEKPSIELVEIHGDQVLADTCKAGGTTTGSVTTGSGCSSRGCFADGTS